MKINVLQLVSLMLRLKQGSVMQLTRDLISALPVPQSAVQNFLFEEAVATITAGPGMFGETVLIDTPL